jgi:UDP-galactose transporter B1
LDYPSQALAKSCKPVFVIGVSMLCGRRFPLYKYVTVLVMTMGAVLFMQDRVTGNVADLLDADQVPFGRLMVLASLFLDGATAHLQDIMSQQHMTHTVESERQRPTAFHLMLYINLWSMLYVFGCMLLSAEQTAASVRFMIVYPESRLLLMLFGVTSGIGQVFIFLAIRHCGALLCSMVTTTRKFRCACGLRLCDRCKRRVGVVWSVRFC